MSSSSIANDKHLLKRTVSVDGNRQRVRISLKTKIRDKVDMRLTISVVWQRILLVGCIVFSFICISAGPGGVIVSILNVSLCILTIVVLFNIRIVVVAVLVVVATASIVVVRGMVLISGIVGIVLAVHIVLRGASGVETLDVDQIYLKSKPLTLLLLLLP